MGRPTNSNEAQSSLGFRLMQTFTTLKYESQFTGKPYSEVDGLSLPTV